MNSDMEIYKTSFPVSNAKAKELSTGILGFAKRTAELHRSAVFEADTRSDLERAGIVEDGHFVFPAGYHCGRFYSFGMLKHSPEAERIVDLIARRFIATTESETYDYIVTHGFEMSHLATTLASILSGRGKSVHTLHAVHTNVPDFLGHDGELRGKRVLVLLDAVHSGKLLEALAIRIMQEGGTIIRIGCVVDFDVYQGQFRRLMSSLCHEKIRSYSPTLEPCPFCQAGVAKRYVELDRGLSTDRKPATLTPAAAQEKLATLFGKEREFWRLVARSHAVVRHRIIGDTHVSPAINVPQLLRFDQAREWISGRIASRLAELAKSGPWTLACVPRKDPSRPVATFVSEYARKEYGQDWPIVGISDLLKARGRPETGRGIPLRILLVDAGVCRGKTVLHTRASLSARGLKDFAFLAIVDRSGAEARAVLQTDFGGRFIGVAEVPFPTFSTADPAACPACWKRAARETFREEEIPEVVRAYLDPPGFPFRRRQAGYSSKPETMALQQELFESIGLEDLNDLFFAVGLHQAAPNDLDEELIISWLGDQHLPDKHKKAIVEYLSPECLGREKIQDTLKAFAQNSIRVSLLESVCVGLARAGRFDWLDERWFLEHREILANEESKSRPPWHFIGFILYAATRRDPGQRQDIEAKLRKVIGWKRDDTPFVRNMESLLEVVTGAARG